MELLTALETIKQTPKMYFGPNPKVDDLFTFLLGWDMAVDTRICRGAISHIAIIKKTGSRIPDSTDIDFYEAINTIVEYLKS